MHPFLARVVLGVGTAAVLMFRGLAIVNAQPSTGAPAASDVDNRAAKKLVEQGIAAQRAKDYDKAIELYEKAFALVPHPILLFDIGQAHRLAGRLEQAVSFYERYLALDPGGSESAAAHAFLAGFHLEAALAQRKLDRDVEARESLERALRYGEEALGAEQLKEAKAQLEEVERRLGRIRVSCRLEGAEVTLDGARLFTCPGRYEGWVKARDHELVARRPGEQSEVRHVTVSAGALRDVELSLTLPTNSTRAVRRWPAWAPWTVAAAGGAVVVTGGVLQVLASRNFRAYDEQFQQLDCWTAARGCTDAQIPGALSRRLERAGQQKRLAVGSYVVGGSLMAAGAVLLYLDRARSPEQKEPRRGTGNGVVVAPSVTGEVVGLWIEVNQ